MWTDLVIVSTLNIMILINAIYFPMIPIKYISCFWTLLDIMNWDYLKIRRQVTLTFYRIQNTTPWITGIRAHALLTDKHSGHDHTL